MDSKTWNEMNEALNDEARDYFEDLAAEQLEDEIYGEEEAEAERRANEICEEDNDLYGDLRDN